MPPLYVPTELSHPSMTRANKPVLGAILSASNNRCRALSAPITPVAAAVIYIWNANIDFWVENS